MRRIHEARGLSRAARQTQLSPASVSARLAELERRLGVTLFLRTTRSLRLTTEGERYLEVGGPVLQLLEEADAAARAAADPDVSGALSGELRIAAPLDLGRQYVAGMADSFLDQHRDLRLTLLLSDDVADLHAENIDLAVRYGDMRSTAAVTVGPLAENHRVVCGAPAYLDREGRPRSVSDLARRNCLCLRTQAGEIRRWPVGRTWADVSGDRLTSDGALLREWAIAGRGLVLKSWWDVRADVLAGRLEVVLPDLPRAPHPLRIVRPTRTGVPQRVAKFATHLRTCFSLLIEADPASP